MNFNHFPKEHLAVFRIMLVYRYELITEGRVFGVLKKMIYYDEGI